jgi:hypothetical protein
MVREWRRFLCLACDIENRLRQGGREHCNFHYATSIEAACLVSGLVIAMNTGVDLSGTIEFPPHSQEIHGSFSG